MAAPNGLNQPPPNLPYAAGGGLDPPAGRHNEILFIWDMVEQLSNQLQINRQRYAELEEQMARAQMRPALVENGGVAQGLVNGNVPHNTQHQTPSSQAAAASEILRLQAELSATRQTLHETSNALTETSDLLQHYNDFTNTLQPQLHAYIHEQQSATIALHAHYNALLEESRNETIKAQIVHQQWQASFMRLSESLREAWKSSNEAGKADRVKIRGLKEENKVLRRLAGWEPASEDESDDEEEEDVQR